MEKQTLLKHIAQTAYNVGFGAKRHFATYEFISKFPNLISLISLIFGVVALIIEEISTKQLSVIFICLGIIGMYISRYDNRKGKYRKAGATLTQLFNELKLLYQKVKDSSDPPNSFLEDLKEIEMKFNSSAITEQMLCSSWLAHYKFFWEQQIDWVDSELKFKLWRDKIPLTFTIFVVLLLGILINYKFEVLKLICINIAPLLNQ